MNNLIYLCALHSIGINQKTLSVIFFEKDNYREVYDKLSTSFLKNYIIENDKIRGILVAKDKLDIEKLENTIKRLNARIITIRDGDYPQNLLRMYSPPYLLYVRGNIIDNSIAFIGAREMSNYGKKIITSLVPEIGKHFTIISGGASGCDTLSHKIALDNGIKTLSVIGTGLEKTYPLSNKKLYEDIIEAGGGIISIFPINEPGYPSNFPIRNEIVAALSSGIVVIEARERSGSLITARLGLELGKDIFAVPGDIFHELSYGTNSLISKGEAKAISKPEDILEEYNIGKNLKVASAIPIIFNSREEEEVYNIIATKALRIDEIQEKTGFEINYLLLIISSLELASIVRKNLEGKYEV